jgi:hypothetical protein
MSVIKPKYGPNNQAITCTLTSLGNGNARSSAPIDNTSNLFLDALVQLQIKSGGSGVDGLAIVYAYGTADGGTVYGGGESGVGTDAAVSLTSPPNVRPIGVINMTANSTTFAAGPFSVAAAFGGSLPDHWGIIVVNNSGAAFDGSVASAWYQGVQGQAV